MGSPGQMCTPRSSCVTGHAPPPAFSPHPPAAPALSTQSSITPWNRFGVRMINHRHRGADCPVLPGMVTINQGTVTFPAGSALCRVDICLWMENIER